MFTINHCGHFPFREAQEEFNATVADFVSYSETTRGESEAATSALARNTWLSATSVGTNVPS
jgi:hypothetical protein